MSEGFFALTQDSTIPAAVRQSLGAVLRLDTGRDVHHRLFDDKETASQWSGFTMTEDAREELRLGWTSEQIAQLDLRPGGEDWARGFHHELIVHLAAGGALPHRTKLTGFATGTLVSQSGFVLTNFHLITGVVRDQLLNDRHFNRDGIPAPHLRLTTTLGRECGSVRLCYADPALDVAILRVSQVGAVTPAPLSHMGVVLHERVWQVGFPHRTNRPRENLQFLEYADAAYDLRYSPGLVVATPDASEWFTDADAVFGSSGSAVFNDEGHLVGIYRGGGAHKALPNEPLRYRRSIDVRRLMDSLPNGAFD